MCSYTCSWSCFFFFFFFFNDTATTEIYTLSLHDALPIYLGRDVTPPDHGHRAHRSAPSQIDRKSTRLNSSHANISYAVFCLKKKKKKIKMRSIKKTQEKKKQNK